MKLTATEKVCQGAALLLALLGFFALVALTSGCANPNTGSSTSVGDITALPEISDAADNIAVKVYYSMTGAKVWTAKDSLVRITYANEYTNRYCGVVETRGRQNLAVEIEPLATDATVSPCETAASTNAVGEVAQYTTERN